MKLLLVFFIILLVELFILCLIPRKHLVEIIDAERQHSVTWFGENKAKEMIDDASSLFNLLFVDTGIVEESRDFFVEHRSREYKEGWQRVSDAPLWDMLVEAMEKFWMVLESGMLRLQIMSVCLLISLSFIVPSLIDGLIKREIQKYGEENVSINIYSVSTLVFCSAFLLPFILLFWPMAISPPYMAIWTLILAGSLWLLASNVQLKV